MIVVFTTLYESSDYCLREFLAMEQIEEGRKQMLGNKYDTTRRMIIPIVIKEGERQSLTPKVKQIQYWDFSRLILRDINPKKNRECEKLIVEIGSEILQHYHTLKGLEDNVSTIDCNKFKIPNKDEVIKWWGVELTEPVKSTPFPGR